MTKQVTGDGPFTACRDLRQATKEKEEDADLPERRARIFRARARRIFGKGQ